VQIGRNALLAVLAFVGVTAIAAVALVRMVPAADQGAPAGAGPTATTARVQPIATAATVRVPPTATPPVPRPTPAPAKPSDAYPRPPLPTPYPPLVGGALTFRVDSAERTKSVRPPMSSGPVAVAIGWWVVVAGTVQNTSSQPRKVVPADFRLRDGAGDTYSPSADPSVAAALAGKNDPSADDLPPGRAKALAMAFDVPVAATRFQLVLASENRAVDLGEPPVIATPAPRPSGSELGPTPPPKPTQGSPHPVPT